MLRNYTGNNITLESPGKDRIILQPEYDAIKINADPEVSECVLFNGVLIRKSTALEGLHVGGIIPDDEFWIVTWDVFVELQRRGYKNILTPDIASAVKNGFGGIHAYTQLISASFKPPTT